MSIMPPKVGKVFHNARILSRSPWAIIAKFTGDGTMNTIDGIISASKQHEQKQRQVKDVDDQWIEKNEDITTTTTTTTTDTNAMQTTTMMMMMEGGTRQLLDLSIWLISTLKRRKKMMNKHKLRKRRKKLRLKTRK